jgi:hypothetical protein
MGQRIHSHANRTGVAAAVLAALAACLALAHAGESGAPARPVVFSELTVDSPPGVSGSWVELYNRGTSAVDLGGVQIVTNGKEVTTLPPETRVEKDGLLLVRFSSETAVLEREPSERGRRNPCITFRAPAWPKDEVVGRPPPESFRSKFVPWRRAGFCVLVRLTSAGEVLLLDYVRWGSPPLPEDAVWIARAKASGMDLDRALPPLPGNGARFPGIEELEAIRKAHQFATVYTGMEATDPSPPFPVDKAAIVRWAFEPETDRLFSAWGAVSLREASPGTENSRLPAPVGLWVALLPDGMLRFNWVLMPPWDQLRERYARKDADVVRLQVSVGRGFISPIVDRWCTEPMAALGALPPPGLYYVRAMWQCGTRTSAWSPEEKFEIRSQVQEKGPELEEQGKGDGAPPSPDDDKAYILELIKELRKDTKRPRQP